MTNRPCFTAPQGGKRPAPPRFPALLRIRPGLLKANSSLLRTENGLTTDVFVVKCTGRGLVVKRPRVLSKVQMLNLVLGVGVFSLLPNEVFFFTANLGPQPPPPNIYFGKKKQHTHRVFGPDFARTLLTLRLDAQGSKSFSPSPGPQENKDTFWCGRPRLSVRTS